MGYPDMAQGVQLPTGPLLWALLPLVALTIALVVYALVDLARAPTAPYLPRWAWVPIILLVNPWGPVVYLILARSQRATRGSGPPVAQWHPVAPPSPDGTGPAPIP